MTTTPKLWKSQTQVNASDAPFTGRGGSSFQGDGQIAALHDGGYVVVWEDDSRTHNPDGAAIVGQRYDAAGNKAGGEVNISQFTGGHEFSPAVTVLPNGNIAVAPSQGRARRICNSRINRSMDAARTGRCHLGILENRIRGASPMRSLSLPALVLSFLILPLRAAGAQVPDAIAAPGEALVTTVHAEGAQVYDCKADATGKLAWQFREPIATLLIDGKTVGRHYAGPNWELADGGSVVGKVAGRAPGATAKDIPLLKLEVVSQRGAGRLTGITTIQRLNTRGGVAAGPCESAGAFLSVPYSADYAFYKKLD